MAYNLKMPIGAKTMTFVEWMEQRLGTRKWAVCRASAKRREKYDCFLSQKRYRKLKEEYELQRS
jgi:hypothetical protein